MADNTFQTKTNNISQICYQDIATHEWIPITEANPLPVGTPIGSPLNIRIIGTTGEAADVVLQPDGTYALRVDSEMTLNVDNVTIGNIKVGTDGTNDTKIKTTGVGSVYTIPDEASIQKVKAASQTEQTEPLYTQSFHRKTDELLLNIFIELSKIRILMEAISDENVNDTDLTITNLTQI